MFALEDVRRSTQLSFSSLPSLAFSPCPSSAPLLLRELRSWIHVLYSPASIRRQSISHFVGFWVYRPHNTSRYYEACSHAKQRLHCAPKNLFMARTGYGIAVHWTIEFLVVEPETRVLDLSLRGRVFPPKEKFIRVDRNISGKDLLIQHVARRLFILYSISKFLGSNRGVLVPISRS